MRENYIRMISETHRSMISTHNRYITLISNLINQNNNLNKLKLASVTSLIKMGWVKQIIN